MTSPSSAPAPPSGAVLPTTVRELLEGYARAHGVSVRVWSDGTNDPVLVFPPGDAPMAGPGANAAPVEREGLRVDIVGESPGKKSAAHFLASAVAQLLQHDNEVSFFSREIAERYEEITLLYSISEILGAVISLEKAAETILEEVVGTLSASRATLWVYEPEHEQLRLTASVGGSGHAEPVVVSDPCSVTAFVFREQHPVLLAPDESFPRPGCEPLTTQASSLLSVPVSYTPPQGEARPVGVINLVGRGRQEPFSASDRKLLSAIASQIGAAVENNRLIAASLQQERIRSEMELAHDLQLKLLPPVESFAGHADVAARCAPASSVGGDFYHLFRLGRGRIGVMIGDVSGHGFSAALIMALTMSAVAIHASEGDPPAEVLRRVHRALIGELESTGMYMTLFYGVIDAQAGTLVYANAGHAHAFRVPATGEPERLGATNPPFGIVDEDGYAETSVSWQAGQDLLFLFTDGLSDGLGEGEIAGNRHLLEEITDHRDLPTPELLERLFQIGDVAGAPQPDDRTAVLVRI